MKLGFAVLLLFSATACLALGALELVADPTDRVGKASHLFFGLAGALFVAAIGVLVL